MGLPILLTAYARPDGALPPIVATEPLRVCRRLRILRDWSHENRRTSPTFSAEVRERAVRMVFERRTEHASQWAAIASIAAKIGCTAQTLSNSVRRAERDQGQRPGASTDERERIKALEQENRSFARPTRSCARPARILPRRSSTSRWKP